MSNQPDFHTNMYCRTYFNKKKKSENQAVFGNDIKDA